jgi:hypothetical protein
MALAVQTSVPATENILRDQFYDAAQKHIDALNSKFRHKAVINHEFPGD